MKGGPPSSCYVWQSIVYRGPFKIKNLVWTKTCISWSIWYIYLRGLFLWLLATKMSTYGVTENARGTARPRPLLNHDLAKCLWSSSSATVITYYIPAAAAALLRRLYSWCYVGLSPWMTHSPNLPGWWCADFINHCNIFFSQFFFNLLLLENVNICETIFLCV